MAKDVLKKEEAEVGLFEGLDSGFEDTSSQTFKMPFLKILQSGSPELKKSDPKYIPGAEAGDFCNSATQELYKELDVIVLKIAHSLIVWRPERGGLVGRFGKEEEREIVASREGVKKWDAEGNSVVDAIEFLCMNANDIEDISVLSMSTASLKHAKSFATRIRRLKCDGKPVNVSWAGIWKIRTVEETNEKGSWFTVGSTPEFKDFITKEIKDGAVIPAKNTMQTAEIDYAAIDASEETGKEPVQY